MRKLVFDFYSFDPENYVISVNIEEIVRFCVYYCFNIAKFFEIIEATFEKFKYEVPNYDMKVAYAACLIYGVNTYAKSALLELRNDRIEGVDCTNRIYDPYLKAVCGDVPIINSGDFNENT